jgi:methyl-accepting chemotaxis protein
VTHQIPEWVFIVFIAVTAIGVLLQAIAMMGILFALRGAAKQVKEVSMMAELHIVPAAASAKRLLDEVGPKMKAAAANSVTLSEKAIEISQRVSEISQRASEASQNVAAVAETARQQSVRVSETLGDILKRTEAQAERVDEMLTGTLDTIAHATATWQRAVAGPWRHVNAVLNGLRAGVSVLRGREPEVHVEADGDHFV